eukprot:Em0004g87a
MLRRGSYTAGERFVPTKSDLSCRVLLMDGSDVVIDLGKKALGQVVFDHVLRRLEILDRDYFGLQLKDGNSRPVWMDFMKPAKKQLKKSSKIYFRVKYYPADPISCHGKARNQFYLQLRVDIAEGRLLCPPNTAPSFYSLILQADTGDYESDERDLEHLREHHLMVQSKSLMDEIIRFHKYHRGMNPQEAVNRFLKKAREIETYGMRFTDVKSEDDEVLYQLGLCPSGIALNRNTRVLNLYKWSRIAQVSYKGKQLTLRIKGHGVSCVCAPVFTQCKILHADFGARGQGDRGHRSDGQGDRGHRSDGQGDRGHRSGGQGGDNGTGQGGQGPGDNRGHRTTPTSPPPSSGPVSRDLQPTPGSPATQSPSTQCPAPGPQNQLSPLLPPAQPSQLSSPPLHKQSPFPQVLPVSQTSPEQHHTSTSQVTRQHAAQTLVTSRSSQALTTPPPSQALPTPPLSQALPTPPPSQALPTPPPSLTPPTSQSSLPSQTPTPAAPSQTSTLPRSTPNAAYWPPSQSSSSSSQAPQPLPPFPQTRVSSASLHAPALPRFLQTIIPPPALQALPPPPSQAPVPPPPSQTPPISQLPSASRTLKTPSTSAIVPPQSLGSWAETLAPSPSSQSIALTSSSLTPVPSPPSQSLSSLSSRTLPTSQTQQPAPPLSQDLESSDASVTRTSRTQLNGQTSSDDATTGGNVRQMRGPSISWNTLVREAMTAEDLPPPPPHLLALSRELASQDPRSLSNDQNRPLSKQPAACDINPDLLPSTGQLNPAFLTGKPAYSASQGMEQYPPEIASFMTRVKGQAGGEAKERGVTGTKNSPESRAKLQQSPSPSLIRRYKSARGPYTQAEILNNRREVRPNLPRNSSNTTTAPRKVSPAKEQYFANRGENEIQVGRLQDIFESFDSLFTSKLTLQPDLSPEKHLYPDGEHREMGQNITSADNRSRPTISSPSTGAVVLEPEETMSLQDQLKMLPNTKKSGKEKVMDWIERSSDLWSYDTQFPMLKDKDTGNPIPQQYQQQGHLYEDPAQVVQGGKSFFVDV